MRTILARWKVRLLGSQDFGVRTANSPLTVVARQPARPTAPLIGSASP
jgi:hypothetical protein